MTKPRVFGLGLSLGLSMVTVAACSGSSSSDGNGGSAGASSGGGTGGGSSGGTGGSSSGGTGGGSSGGSSGTGGAAGSDSGTPSCGSVGLCLVGTTCVEEVFEPTCENLSDPNGQCPPGKTKTMCGGAGFPCCCDPPPASQFSCQPTTACKGTVDCSCITCPSGKVCMATVAGPFRCEEPPKP